MMEHSSKLTLLLFCTLVSPALPVWAETGGTVNKPQQYTAVYEVLRNNSKLAKVTTSLTQQNGTWTFHGFTHDMQGLADVLNVKGAQSVTGKWQDGLFLPENYSFSFSLIGYKTAWHADFDWPAGVVTTKSKSGNTELSLANGAMDPFSLFLNISSFLSDARLQMAAEVIDEDEIENHVYHVEHEESVETALGCMETTRVRRIRNNSKRTSLAWYANDFGYIPVQVQHFKKKGKGLGLQIISLEIAGQAVQPLADCNLNNP